MTRYIVKNHRGDQDGMIYTNQCNALERAIELNKTSDCTTWSVYELDEPNSNSNNSNPNIDLGWLGWLIILLLILGNM